MSVVKLVQMFSFIFLKLHFGCVSKSMNIQILKNRVGENFMMATYRISLKFASKKFWKLVHTHEAMS